MIPPLPTRELSCEGLPKPFARPQLDHAAPSFALTADGPVISCDAWSGRRLAVPRHEEWAPITPAHRWFREPRWAAGSLLALAHRPGAETGECYAGPLAGLRPTGRRFALGEVAGWDGIAITGRRRAAAGGPRPEVRWRGVRIALPPGAVLQDVSERADRRLCLVTARTVGGTSTLCIDSAGRQLGEPLLAPLVGHSEWIGPGLVLVLVSRWPSVLPALLDVRTGELRLWPDGAAAGAEPGVADTVAGRDGAVAFSWSTPSQPRHVRLLDSTLGWVPYDPCPVGQSPGARIVAGPAGPLPCLVLEPAGAPVGTVVLYHGEPNGAHYATWSALAESLQDAGWRVIRPNIRGSAVRDARYRPGLPDRYGGGDVADAVAVAREFGGERLVVGGMSYGAYLAVRVAAELPAVRGAFLIGGFFQLGDLIAARHRGSQAFLSRVDLRNEPEPRPDARYFVVHGTNDRRVPISGVRRHLPGLLHHEMVELSGEGHGLNTDQGARIAVPPLFEWLDKL